MALDDAVGLVEHCAAAGGVLRVLGGVAVAVRCPSARHGQPLSRTYSDLDFATTRRSVPAVSTVMDDAGYIPDKQFNLAHGRQRLIFDSDGGWHVDVFVDRFSMCHELPLGQRLEIDSDTLTLADLLLTKAQVAELNRKDVTDCVALLADHELTSSDDGINVEYIAEVLANDWGWWRTVTENLRAIAELAPQLAVGPEIEQRARERGARLLAAIEERPKAVKWRMRARIGDRVPWREEPEEARE
jgi:hypothetical protein